MESIRLDSLNVSVSPVGYVSDKQLAAYFSVSRATIWRWVKEKRIPEPIRLSPGCTRWKTGDFEVDPQASPSRQRKTHD